MYSTWLECFESLKWLLSSTLTENINYTSWIKWSILSLVILLNTFDLITMWANYRFVETRWDYRIQLWPILCSPTVSIIWCYNFYFIYCAPIYTMNIKNVFVHQSHVFVMKMFVVLHFKWNALCFAMRSDVNQWSVVAGCSLFNVPSDEC